MPLLVGHGGFPSSPIVFVGLFDSFVGFVKLSPCASTIEGSILVVFLPGGSSFVDKVLGACVGGSTLPKSRGLCTVKESMILVLDDIIEEVVVRLELSLVL